jgi:arylsulfatase A-like enzyme
LQTTMNRTRWYWRFDTPEKHQQMVKGYYRMVSAVDSVLARIRVTLEQEKIADNTVIIFMSDNGYFLGERGYAGKWLLYEQSIKIPLIIYDPRQPESRRGKTYEEMVLNIDVTSTILRLAGVPIPNIYHGESLTAFYNGAPGQWRTGILLEHRLENNKLLLKTDGYRDDTWKFIRYDDNPLIELYNYREDIHETVNLAIKSEYADKVDYYMNKCNSIANKLLSDRIHEIQQ